MGNRMKIVVKSKKVINEYSVIFCFQYIALIMYVLNIAAYIQRVYTLGLVSVSLIFLCIYRMRIHKFIKSQIVVLVYMSCNAIVGAMNGNDLHTAITNIFPIFFMILTEQIVYSSKKRLNTTSVVNGLAFLSLISSIAIIIATIINIISGGIQEGYRFLAMQITCIGPLLLYYYFFVKKNKLFFLTGVLSMIAIVATYSKQMYLSVFVLVVFIIFIGDRKLSKKIRNAVIFIVLIIGAVAFLQIVGKRGGMLGTLADAFSYNFEILTNREILLTQETPRLTEMKYAIERLRQAWIFGIGSGAAYTTYGLQNWVHNGWLWMVLNFGIFGTTLFCFPIFGILFKGFKTMKKMTEKKSRFVFFFLLSGAVLILFNGLFSPIFFRESAIMVYLGLYLGLLIIFSHEKISIGEYLDA